jgi:WD repeat-containing protein 48
VQTHTDWVNDLVLCNMNQTVITASSDRTIRAWSPHAAEDELAVPALIGQHTDYVRSLAFARTAGVLFSGALDRDISVWDIAGPRPNDPVLKVRLGDMDDNSGIGLEGEWGSIYALGVDPLGHTLAAGTPERVVRLWDPRAGDRSVTKLVGHTECVRSILLSDDGRYMLTGSSDTTIKWVKAANDLANNYRLWSVGEHRCLHTFNHHTSSVWALHSNHPNLERFYSGSRDGHLCVVDVEQVGDLSEGECVVLAREGEAGAKGEQESKTGDEAIRSITSMDDEYVWTATASSNVHRWRDVGRRVYRMELDGASYPEPTSTVEEARPLVNVGSVIDRPTSIIDKPRTKALAVDDNELARTESRESRTITFAPDPKVESSPVSAMSALSLAPPSPSSAGAAASGVPASVRERLNNGSRRAASISSMLSVRSEMSVAEQEWGLHGLPYESLVCLGLPDAPYSLGFSGAAHSTASLASAMRARSVEDSPEQAVSERALNPRSAARRAFEDRDVASEAVPFRAEPDAVITGSPGLIRSLVLNDRLHVLTLDTTGEVAVWHLLKGTCLGRFAPKDIAEALELERGVADARLELKLHPHEVLELVQHRIEGKNSVLPWCQVDTKVGHITVHLEGDRVFAADVIPDELGVELVADTEGRPLNIGKVVLGNLFQGLIKAEEMELQSVISSSPTTVASSLPSISRSPVPPSLLAVDLASPHPRHRQRALSSTSLTLTGSGGGTPTPSINITGLATRAERAAIRPDAPFGQSAPASSSGWLSAASGGAVTPLRSGAFAALGGSAATPTSTTSDIPARDYFSLRKEPTSASASAAGTAAASPAEKKEALPLPQSPGPASNGSSSSGGGLLSKKFKAFGKKKQAEPQMTTVVESKLEERVEAKGPELQLSERDKSQLLFLDGLRARTFAPPPPVEVPPVALPPATAVIISEQSQADGAYFVTYRSQVSSTERDMEPLEMNSPFWLLDFLFTDSTPEERRVPKIPLILLPAGESVGSGKG